MFRFITQKIKTLRSKDDGNVTVEFVIYAPLLFFIFMMVYTFYDAFRQESINLKAAYTVSDLLSRETREVNDDYIDSMFGIANLMVRQNSNLSMRITLVRYDEASDQFYIDWSRQRGNAYLERTDGNTGEFTDINEVRERLPNMPDQERVILVETIADIVPPFNIGVGQVDITNFVFSRPRFAPIVRFEGIEIPGVPHDDATVFDS
ncbi:Flp pilus assembly protein TadG [Epibacterium ulvae]|uniref:Flp pilus assembly protein TadG n=1 Tax=Epibacterium ulvae TaxID=1156985 RepID=A0A1G5QRL5_9RHOB|nr:hypothetical protein [Epibacterium ulvae]SCZ64407.1 Flp pilus assembly protein TadG [Epibacterium ulvae]